jgi:hypothetical protein
MAPLDPLDTPSRASEAVLGVLLPAVTMAVFWGMSFLPHNCTVRWLPFGSVGNVPGWCPEAGGWHPAGQGFSRFLAQIFTKNSQTWRIWKITKNHEWLSNQSLNLLPTRGYQFFNPTWYRNFLTLKLTLEQNGFVWLNEVEWPKVARWSAYHRIGLVAANPKNAVRIWTWNRAPNTGRGFQNHKHHENHENKQKPKTYKMKQRFTITKLWKALHPVIALPCCPRRQRHRSAQAAFW